MPSQILHVLFGEDVIAAIYGSIHTHFGIVAEKALEKITGDYHASFMLGCQGPDIFYHNQFTRPLSIEYGTLLHHRGYGIFTAELLKRSLPDPPPDEKDFNALGAYSLGFMTHALLDRYCHPYIVYKAGWTADAGEGSTPLGKTAHAFFERILDVLMFEYLRGKPVHIWKQEALAAVCSAPPPGLKELLAKALCAVYPERAGNDEKLLSRIENAFIDCERVYRHTDPALTGIASVHGNDNSIDAPVLPYIFPQKFPLSVDYLNLAKKAYFDPAPGGKEDNRSFPELYSAAVSGAAAALGPDIKKYLETGIYPIREAAQSIGNSGLSIRGADGRPCAPVRSVPLPLDSVLEQQRRLRYGK
ncbi:hypothetical protein FACS1894151_00380 [Spirochaetia bacterium]|nr:hypothetical protein FACS1894151_00380 [Spirochaetia bacterium]